MTTPNGENLLREMAGAGPLSIRDVVRQVARDEKSLQRHAYALLKAEVIDHVNDGRTLFPYDEIRADFVLRTARFIELFIESWQKAAGKS